MTSIIFLFKLVHLNDLLFNEKVHDVVEEVNVKEALKSSIFDVQKAAAPKNIVEFCQSSTGSIRSTVDLLSRFQFVRQLVCLLW